MAVEELFKTAPREVVDYFDRRPTRPSFRWSEVAPREHALQFTVARTAGFDVLDIAGMLDRFWTIVESPS